MQSAESIAHSVWDRMSEAGFAGIRHTPCAMRHAPCTMRYAFFDSLVLSGRRIHDMQAPYAKNWLD